MGSFFSTTSEPEGATADPEQLPATDFVSSPLHREAADDAQTWYADFWEKAACVRHVDGVNIIICSPSGGGYGNGGFVPNPREEEGWAVTKMRMVYDRLSEDGECERIVKYIRTLQDGSILVETLSPGPLTGLTLPTLTVPISDAKAMSRQDTILLSLYYRWALQSLSALTFLHSHKVNMKFFSSQNVWLRSNLSLAVTGFISAVLDHHEDDHGEDGGWAGDETIMYSGEETAGDVKEDLFYWATFVWRLLTNEFTPNAHWIRGEVWEPVSPAEGGLLTSNPDVYKILGERQQGMKFQELEDERLGSVLVAAWMGQYESVEEVKEQVTQMASRAGIEIVSDNEVDIGKAWEDILQVSEVVSQHVPKREVRFKQDE